MSLYAKRTDVGVAISSDIETSWKKWTGDVSALPNAYKRRDPITHKLLNEPNGKAVLLVPDSADSSKNIWKLQCLRDGDGTMTVHTIGTKKTVTLASGTGTDQVVRWYGLAHFDAHPIGFQNPLYKWKLGNTIANSQSSYLDTVDGSAMFPPSTSHYLKLADDKLPMGRSSNINVEVTESNNSQITADNTYTVNWHKPLENYKDVPDASYPRTEYKLWTTTVASCSVSAGGQITDKPEGAKVRFNTTLLGRYEYWSNYVMDKLGSFWTTAAVGSELRDALVDAGFGSDSDNGEREESVNTNSESMFNKAKEIGHAPNCTDFDSSKLVKPLFYQQLKLRHIRGDAYNKNGFTGVDDQIYASAFDDQGVAYGQGWTGKYEPVVAQP